MSRPKINIDKTFGDQLIEALTFLLIFGSAIYITIYYDRLPDSVPIYFNWPSVNENGFGNKDLLWINPIICGIITALIYKLNEYPWVFNYPKKITSENAKYNYRKATLVLRIVALGIGFLCLILTSMSINRAL